MLTDNDIINGAEHCLNPKYACDVCPYTDKGEYAVQCMAVLIKDQLSLIQCQKAEVERLQSMNQAKLDMIHDIQADNERLKKDKYRLQKALNQSEDYRTIAQAEAIKEFEEKSENTLIALYNKYHDIANKPKKETDMYYQGRAEAIWECISINRNLVKEMVG